MQKSEFAYTSKRDSPLFRAQSCQTYTSLSYSLSATQIQPYSTQICKHIFRKVILVYGDIDWRYQIIDRFICIGIQQEYTHILLLFLHVQLKRYKKVL